MTAKIENLADLFDVEKGVLSDDQVRRIEVRDALVDTGATTLLLPERMVAALGLKPLRTRHSRALGGEFLLPMLGRQSRPPGRMGRGCVRNGSALLPTPRDDLTPRSPYFPAADDVLSGRLVGDDQRPSIGCNIKWKRGNAPDYA